MHAVGRPFLLFSAMLTLIGCYPVSESDLVGSWTITPESRELLPEQYQEGWATLVLEPDGTFTISNAPGELIDAVGVVSGSGQWELVDHPDASDGPFSLIWAGDKTLRLTLTTLKQGQAPDLPTGAQMFVQGARGGPRLHYFRVDPDGGRRINFSLDHQPPS